MLRIALIVLACATASSACAPALQRSSVSAPLFDATTHTLWIVEHDTQAGRIGRLAVTICQREATPACVRLAPHELRDVGEYARWMETLPPDIRRLAATPAAATSTVLPAPALESY